MLVIISCMYVYTYRYQADIFLSPATKARLHALTLLATAIHASCLSTSRALSCKTPVHVLSYLKIRYSNKKRTETAYKIRTIVGDGTFMQTYCTGRYSTAAHICLTTSRSPSSDHDLLSSCHNFAA